MQITGLALFVVGLVVYFKTPKNGGMRLIASIVAIGAGMFMVALSRW